MRANGRTTLQRGDVLHVHRYGEINCDCWVFVSAGGPHFSLPGYFVAGPDIPTNRDHHTRDARIDEDDRYQIVPAEQVPDHVMAEITKLTLMGELNADDEE